MHDWARSLQCDFFWIGPDHADGELSRLGGGHLPANAGHPRSGRMAKASERG
jgi:hypothetical protein